MRALIRVGLVVLAVIPSIVAAQTTVGSNGSIGQFAVTYDASAGEELSWGQTFRTPNSTEIQLDSWSFWLNALANPAVTIQLQIAEWNGTGLASNPFFTSASYTPTVAPDGQQATFAIDRVLDPTKTYIAFVNPVSPDATSGDTRISYTCPECLGQPAYLDGDLIFLQSSGPGQDLANNPATSNFESYDLQFSATFSAVVTTPPVTATPEPASLALVATGLVGIAGFVRKRRAA